MNRVRLFCGTIAVCLLVGIGPVRADDDKGGLVDKLANDHALLWQKATASYRDLAGQVRKAVLLNDYGKAGLLMDRAKNAIRASRHYAADPSQYEDFRNQAKALERYVADEQRKHDDEVVHQKLAEINRREAARIRQKQDSKHRQVRQLMDQAAELRKEQRYEDAIEVLKQVLGSDPTNERALWMKETLEDIA
ncbi:MAG: hypothetical protein ACE5F9_11435, partial [Phycisphaerae bacterium]